METYNPDTFFIAPQSVTTALVCSLKVVDDDDQVSCDATTIAVTDLAPFISTGKDTTVGIGTKIHLRATATDDGRIVKYEWSLGGAEWVETSSGDTTVVAPLEEGAYECAVRVTDDDGRVSSDFVSIRVMMYTAHTVHSAPFALSPESIVPSDVDQDGDIDLIITGGTLTWYENDGEQNFLPRTISANSANAVVAVDLDGDGDIDLATAGGTLTRYENDGEQNFLPRIISPSLVLTVTAVDIDGDSDVDLATTDRSNLIWYNNNGDQGFSPHMVHNNPGGVDAAIASDIDSDGDVDFVSGSAKGHIIRLHDNIGLGGFRRETLYTNAFSSRGELLIEVADLDLDGDPDLVTVSSSDHKMLWIENQGVNGFIAHTIYENAKGEKSISPMDIDGDGDVDLLTASSYFRQLRLYSNDGSGAFTVSAVFSQQVNCAAAVDIDNDGDVDLVSGSSVAVRWHENHREKRIQ